MRQLLLALVGITLLVTGWSQTYRPIFEISANTQAEVILNQPHGLAVDTNNQVLYVADALENKILKLDYSGNFICQWGAQGTVPGLFDGPRDIAVDSLGNIYVTDVGNARVQKFDSLGTFILTFGQAGSGDGEFTNIRGIAYDPNGFLYVSQQGAFSSRVQKFDLNGMYLATLGSFDSGASALPSPQGLAVNAQGEVFVADSDLGVVKKYNDQGSLLGRFSDVDNMGTLSEPQDIAIDKDGNIFVIDADQSVRRLFKFDSNFSFIDAVDNFSTTNAELLGLAINESGLVFLSDRVGQRIRTFSNLLALNGDFGTGLRDQQGDFGALAGLAVDKDLNIITSDAANQRIQIFDKNGVFVRSFGSDGTADDEFLSPGAVKTDDLGRIYVADASLQDIRRFSPTGGFQATLKPRSMVLPPTDFVISQNGGLYFSFYFSAANTVSRGVRQLAADGMDLGGIGFLNPGDPLGRPAGVAMDTAGNIYVVDTEKNLVGKYAPNMGFLKKWGTMGDQPGEFNNPYGIFINHENQVVIADSGNNRVQFFDLDGNFIKEYGSTGSQFGSFVNPIIAVTDTLGNLYVADSGNDRIQVLEVCDVLTEIDTTICANQMYSFGGESLTMTGIYRDTIPFDNQCDSIVELDLTVLPSFSITVTRDVCQGDTIFLGMDTITTTGIYRDTMASIQNGCDSIVMLDLTVKDTFLTVFKDTLCLGDTLRWENRVITRTGLYTEVYPENMERCDSVIQRMVTVLDTFYTVINDTICVGESLQIADQSFTQSGKYMYTFPKNEERCDSTIELNLIVKDTFYTQVFADICEGDTYSIEDRRFFRTGQYLYTYPENSERCDSVIEINLRVLPNFDILRNEEICLGDTLQIDGFKYFETGVYSINYQSTNERCDSLVRIDLTVLDTFYTVRYDTICQGEVFLFEEDVYFREGKYLYVYPRNETRCDSTVEINLTILPIYSVIFPQEICDGDTLFFEDLILTTDGQHEYVYPANEERCDSTIVIDLNVLPSYDDLYQLSLCKGDTLFLEDQFRTTDGSLEFLYQTEEGCDSMVTLDAIFQDTFYTVIDRSICIGESTMIGNVELRNSGTFLFSYPSLRNGCDSTVEVNLTVLDTFYVKAEREICRGGFFTFGGRTLNQDGVYFHTFPPTDTRCDSTVELTLKTLGPTRGITNINICEGDSIALGRRVFKEQGMFEILLSSSKGCDSILTVNIGVLPRSFTTLKDTICSLDFYDFNGQMLNMEGQYMHTLQSSNGCDSIVTLDLVVLQNLRSRVNRTICEGESVSFAGGIVTMPGLYIDSLLGQNGCYFYSELLLTVNPSYYDTTRISICQGDSVQFQRQFYKQTGLYQRTFRTIAGCDSIFVLDLQVDSVYDQSFSFNICEGDSVLLGDRVLRQTGVYRDTFQSMASCDSIVALSLNVSPVYNDTFDLFWCGGLPYQLGPLALQASGTYSYTFRSQNGCDSTVTVNLEYEDVDRGLTLGGILLSAKERNARYQWVDCADTSIIIGATERFFLPDGNGTYAVFIQTDSCVYLSECSEVLLTTSTDEHDISSGVLLYPNPNSGEFYLDMSADLIGEYEVQVMNLQGQLFYRQKRFIGDQERIETSNLPPGIYMLLLRDEEGRTARRRFTKINR